jgi:hypothetical protein
MKAQQHRMWQQGGHTVSDGIRIGSNSHSSRASLSISSTSSEMSRLSLIASNTTNRNGNKSRESTSSTTSRSGGGSKTKNTGEEKEEQADLLLRRRQQQSSDIASMKAQSVLHSEVTGRSSHGNVPMRSSLMMSGFSNVLSIKSSPLAASTTSFRRRSSSRLK